MTFRKPVRKDFPEGQKGDYIFKYYELSDGCDDGKPKGWTPCFVGSKPYTGRNVCSFWNTDKCPHGQGV